MNTDVANPTARNSHPAVVRRTGADALAAEERRRAANYPISRWYLRPAAAWLARALAPGGVRPAQLTFCGLLAAAVAATVLLRHPQAMPIAAVFVLVYWFFDRADGQLARRQQTVTKWGAWLDANVDELVDVGLHVAMAAAAARRLGASWPWFLLIAFLAGKYLLMYGLTTEEHPPGESPRPLENSGRHSWLQRMYHLPGNADVRLHLVAAALVTGWITAELALVAVYYNLRWIVRYLLLARRWGDVR